MADVKALRVNLIIPGDNEARANGAHFGRYPARRLAEADALFCREALAVVS